jgi:putative copper resistance protein D
LTAVVIVSVTGVINAYYLLGGPSNLLATAYGRVLLVKLTLFVVILGLGAMNRVYLRRGLMHGVNLRKLRMNVAVEIVLAAGVVVAVGYLGLMMPGAHTP